MSTNVSWVVYLVNERLWMAGFAPALAIGSYGIFVVLLLRSGGPMHRGWCLPYSAVLVLAALVGNHALGSLLVVSLPCS